MAETIVGNYLADGKGRPGVNRRVVDWSSVARRQSTKPRRWRRRVGLQATRPSTICAGATKDRFDASCPASKTCKLDPLLELRGGGAPNHGRTYIGGSGGSSHRGGTYSNPRMRNAYGTRK